MTKQATSVALEAPVIPLEDLPRHSPWPARLLGLSPWQKRVKTEEELYREYEVEMFSTVLEKARTLYPGKAFADWFAGETEQHPAKPCLTKGGIRLLPPRLQLDTFIDVVEDTIASHLPATALCDLGAGTGKVLYCLAERGVTQQTPLMAFEYSPSARALIRHFARNQSLDLEVHACNLLQPRITEASIPKGAILFTSATLACLPLDTRKFLQVLLELKPRLVIHFEPCSDLLEPDNLYHMMCRRYLEVNDYNGTTHSAARELETQGALRVHSVRPNVHGSNPLLPLSVVTWAPV